MYQIDFAQPIHVYFVGIGGISMSGLAQILLSRGFKVSGSDRSASELTDRLSDEGVAIHIPQAADNITSDIDLAVFTAAIHPDNPEYIRIHELGIPSISRAELLGQLMKGYEVPVAVSGTHGKTTTTSMISEILMAAGTDPTLTIGGSLPSIGGNVRVGGSRYFVAEACEYTNSFLSMYPKVGIILDIDADHLDFFKDLDDIRHSFREFAALIPEDGVLIINSDIPELPRFTEGLSCRVITYGSSPESDYHPADISYDSWGHPGYTAVVRSGFALPNIPAAEQVQLSVPGEHNVYNSLAALAAADVLGIRRSDAVKALRGFHGTDRRFQVLGDWDGVTVVDDYAHHPTEIEATLRAAGNIPHGTLYCVFQPHTYTRTKALLKEFAASLCLADTVILADIYAARETDTLGVSSKVLQDEILALGHPCHYFGSFAEIEKFLSANCQKGDLLITMGAGNVDTVARDLLAKGCSC